MQTPNRKKDCWRSRLLDQQLALICWKVPHSSQKFLLVWLGLSGVSGHRCQFDFSSQLFWDSLKLGNSYIRFYLLRYKIDKSSRTPSTFTTLQYLGSCWIQSTWPQEINLRHTFKNNRVDWRCFLGSPDRRRSKRKCCLRSSGSIESVQARTGC